MPKIDPIICYLDVPQDDLAIKYCYLKLRLLNFYRLKLKNYKIIRYLLVTCYQIGLSVRKEAYIFFSYAISKIVFLYPILGKPKNNIKLRKRRYKLITHCDAVRLGLISVSENLLLESAVKLKKINVHPKEMSFYVNENITPECFPAVNLYKVENATTFGGSSIAFANGVNNYAIIHDLYNYKRDLFYEESRNYLAIAKSGNLTSFLSPACLELESAVSFLDGASGNYAHWITEVLPRIYLFIVKLDKDLPIIIDRDVHPNMIDFIRSIAKPTTRIFAVGGGEGVKVNNLYFVSTVGYASLDPRETKAIDHPEGFFCSEIIFEMSTYFRSIANPTKHNRKLFVKRSSFTRSIINIDQVEKFLILNGYEVVYLERMSLLSQIKTISEASHIVAQAGAACANFIFCQEDTKIVILAGASKSGGFNYWENILGFANLNITLLLGSSIGDTTSHHTDFNVTIDQLEDLI